MHLHIQISQEPIPANLTPLGPSSATGAFVEFRGLVRGEEEDRMIGGLVYEAYQPMAEREIARIAASLSNENPVHSVLILHRIGPVPVGEAAIYLGVAARHRAEAFAFVTGFLDLLKRDVPIWKTDTLPAA